MMICFQEKRNEEGVLVPSVEHIRQSSVASTSTQPTVKRELLPELAMKSKLEALYSKKST